MSQQKQAVNVCVIQEESTDINVRSYWPSVVASGAMLLATDALTIERTHGSFILSVCDRSIAELSDYAYLQVGIHSYTFIKKS